MGDNDIEAVVDLIGRAMNQQEAVQAEMTFEHHFKCAQARINDGRQYFVLKLEIGVVGVVGLHHYSWGPSQNIWLAWFAIEPAAQGSGFGQLLLDAIIQRAQECGYAKLFIETYSTAEFGKARAFYRSNGFVRVGHVKGYLEDGGHMVVFYKALTHNA